MKEVLARIRSKTEKKNTDGIKDALQPAFALGAFSERGELDHLFPVSQGLS